MIGVTIFNEALEVPVIIGSIMVVSSGLYAFWRENYKKSK